MIKVKIRGGELHVRVQTFDGGRGVITVKISPYRIVKRLELHSRYNIVFKFARIENNLMSSEMLFYA